MTAECPDGRDGDRAFDARDDRLLDGRDGGGRDRMFDDPENAVARINERAETVRDRELERALARLEARGDLSAPEREAVERLADRLVTRLLAVPERSLREAAEADDEETVETALSLFG